MYSAMLYSGNDIYFENPKLLYDDSIIDLRAKVLEPTITLEDNASGSFEFSIYSENQCYSPDPDPMPKEGETYIPPQIQMLTSTIKVFKNGEEIWEGRPITCEEGFFNDLKYHVEGALSYFNDIPQPTKDYAPKPGEEELEIVDFIKGVLTEYNKYASPNRKFDVDSVYCYPYRENSLLGIEESGFSKITLGGGRMTGGETTFSAISNLVSSIGGHVKAVTVEKQINGSYKKVRTLYFTAMNEPEADFIGGSQVKNAPYIQYGKNLMELTRTIDCTGVFTAILPVGAEIGPDKPETILTMCDNVPLAAFGRSTNIEDKQEVTCFDSVQFLSVYTYGNLDSIDRRVVGATFGEGSGNPIGYDYYLFTTTAVHENSSRNSVNGYYYYFEDVSKTAGYPNARILSREQHSFNQWDRKTKTGLLFSVPDKGKYNLEFSCGNSYASYTKVNDVEIKGRVLSTVKLPTNASNGDVYYCVADKKYYEYTSGNWAIVTGAEDWILPPETTPAQLQALSYPLLLRAPYPRDEYRLYNISRVPDAKRLWIGATSAGDYGINDTDIDLDNTHGEAFKGYVRIVNTPEWSGHYLDSSKWPPSWQADYQWASGHFGRRLCRVLVEPGRTYYLNTRVTNAGYPTDDDAIEVGGHVKSRTYAPVYAYAIMARKRHVDAYDPNAVFWLWEMVSGSGTSKEASKGNQTTICDMEKIVIPDGIYPENEVNPDSLHFYNETGTALDNNTENVNHLELWFSCDQVYFGENLVDDHYLPDIFIENNKSKTALVSEATSEFTYKDKVTVAPVNDKVYPSGSPYGDLPREVLVNTDLADRYGLIVRNLTYDDVTNPTELLRRARIYMSLMRNKDAIEVTAMELELCGITGYRDFIMFDKIPLISEPQPGVNGRSVTLTGMTIALDDQSKNAYSFGYDSSKDLSAIAAANGGSDV